MELTPEYLSDCYLHSLSPDLNLRRAAEGKLTESLYLPNYGLAVLRVVADLSVDECIRHAAAVSFKNHLHSRWSPSPESSSFTPIGEYEKHHIKSLIVTLMLSSSSIPLRIQSQLSESISLIGKHDFPKSWPDLLPELFGKLNSALGNNDYASVNRILGMANSIFKKFRYQYKTKDLLLDLKYCQDNFCAPLLLCVFHKTADLIESVVSNSGGGGGGSLKPLFESQRLCCRIFYSLNFQELPEFFEDNMDQWMIEFRKYLTTSYPSLESSSDGLKVVDDLRAAVCENINLLMEKNEELFRGYVKDFAKAISTLLVDVSQSTSGRDRLAITAIKFLTMVRTGVQYSLFATHGAIPQIFRLRDDDDDDDDDEELFKTNYIEFLMRDMEGEEKNRVSIA